MSYYVNTTDVYNVDANITTSNTVTITHTSSTAMKDISDGTYVTFSDVSNSYPLDKDVSSVDYKVSNVSVSPVTTQQTLTGTNDVSVHTDTINGAVTSSSTIVIDTGSFAIQVGQIVTGTGIPTNTTISAITNNKTYTLSTAVTISDGEAIGFFNREDTYSLSNVIITTFTVEESNVTANISSSSLSVQTNNGLKFTTDMDLSTIATNSYIKLKNAGPYSGIFPVASTNTGTGEIGVFGNYVDGFSVTQAFTGVDTNLLTIANLNSAVSVGMVVSGGNVASGTKVVNVTNTGVELSANANSDANSNITFSDDLYGNATVVSDRVDVTLASNHSLAIDGTDPIVNKTVNIIEMEPEYYNWAWNVNSVPTQNTLLLQGFGYDHPYTTGGNTYISKEEFLVYGTEGRTTTPPADSDAYLISKHEGEIYVNGAKVATAFPMHTSQEYVDEINRQIQIKNGAVVSCGSFRMSLPGKMHTYRNGSSGSMKGFTPAASLPNNTVNAILDPNRIPKTPGTATAVNTLVNNNTANPYAGATVTPAGTPTTKTHPAAQSSRIPIATPIGPKLSVANGTLKPLQESRYNNAVDPTPSTLNYTDYTNHANPSWRALGGVWMGKPGLTYGWHPTTGKRGLYQWIGQMGFVNTWKDPNQLPPPPGAPSFGPAPPQPFVTPIPSVPTVVPPSITGPSNNTGGTGGGSTGSNPAGPGVTVASFEPLIAITQHDDACPIPPTPPTPPTPPVGQSCVHESNKLGRGVTETFNYVFTSDTSKTYTVKMLFDTYSAKDRIRVYQGQSKIAGTDVSSTLSNITQADINAWQGTSFAIGVGSGPYNNNNFGTGVNSLLGQNYQLHANGFVTENGKLTFTYDASRGQNIRVTVEKDASTSTAFRYFMCYPVDDAAGTGFPAQGGTVGTGNPPPGGNQTNLPNFNNQSQTFTLPGFNLNMGIPNIGVGAFGSVLGGGNYGIGGGGRYGGFGTAIFPQGGAGMGGSGKPNSSIGQYYPVNYVIGAGQNSYLAGTYSSSPGTYNQNVSGGGNTYVPPTTGVNSNPTNNQSYLTITGLTQNSTTGTFGTIPQSTTNVPICTPKARVKVCGENKTVGKGDSFYINGDSITLSGATSLTAIQQEILSQTSSVNVFITSDKATQEKCLLIRNKLSDPIIIRNGCAGGVYKEVLDYNIRQDQQMCFNKEVVQGPTTLTNTASGSGNASIVGTSVASYTTDTITPEENKQKFIKNSICVTEGKGYKEGDILRVMGGTPVVQSATTSIESVVVSNPGYGYVANGIRLPIQIRIGSRGEPGSGAEIDPSSVIYDDNGGIKSIRLASIGSGYSIDNPPTITVMGGGRNAILTAKLSQQQAVEKPAKFIVELVDADGGIKKLKIFDRGTYKIFPSDLDSGVPLQYDTKRPISGVASSELLGSDKVTSDGQEGQGAGARVFLTARDIPSCSEKGTALTDLGLPEGYVGVLTPPEQLADDIGLWSQVDPDGNPYFGGEASGLGDDGELREGGLRDRNDPFAVVEIFGPNIDGIRLSDPLNPGFLNSLGILEGDYVCDEIPLFKNIDETNIDPKIEVQRGLIPNSALFNNTGIGPAGNFQGTLPWNTAFNLGMNLGNASAIENLYEYELRQLDGISPITFTDPTLERQNVKPLLLKSERYDTDAGLDLANISNVWIDNYNNKGWAYLESGEVIRQQENLTDLAFIDDAIIYDEETAEKEYDINLYDPFKGIIPGFIDKEITYKSETDPVVYDQQYTKFGKEQVGQTWWDTSQVRYNWYEQGAGTYTSGYNNVERNRNWGSKFPGSEIVIYEWVESLEPPTSYTGEGMPIASALNTTFITEMTLNKKGKEVTYYYFWVRGLSSITNATMLKLGREKSILELEQLLDNPEGNRLPYLGLMSPDSYTVNKLGDLIKTEDSIVSLNFRRKDSGLAKKHASWSLAGEGSPTASIPNNLSIKVIDSLAGYNAIYEEVPVNGLSASERYGSSFRPRQTMFKDIKAARKQMFESLNDIFAEVKMNTAFNNWRDGLPESTPNLDTVNWFEYLRTDKTTGTRLYYNSDYKPLRNVKTEKQLKLIKNILDKSIIQVQSNNNEAYKLFEYSKASNTFKLIAMQDETVQWNESIYTVRQTIETGKEIRQVLEHLYKNVFTDSNKIYWNRFFFAMLKFAIGEQQELDWAFKSTYLNVVKKETDLVPFKGLKVDNFDKAIDYFNEVKPYASKIRNYRDIKQAPIENLVGSTGDFDRPPYFDEDAQNVRILDINVEADANILANDKDYAGFISNSSNVRKLDTKMIFDRVKADLFENSSGQQLTKIVAVTNNTSLALSFVPTDVSRLVVKINDVVVPATGNKQTGDRTTDADGNDTFSTSSTTVTNWTYNAEDNVIDLNKTASDNPMLLNILPGDVLEISCVDGYDPTTETLNNSIAKNIVKIEQNSNANISSGAFWTASDREFKFNTNIRTAFITAMDSAHGVGAGSNTTITTNTSIMTDMVTSGNLNTTISLVKTAVGGDFNGSMLDANTFIDVVPGTHPTTYYTDTRGFDFFLWDDDVWDKDVKVDNFHGVFNEDRQGNLNYRVNNETVFGFDAVTFTKSAYGPDRPEELIVVQPFETLVMNVYTSNVSHGNVAISTTSSKPVKHTMFVDLFGRTDFYRQSTTGLTTTSAVVNNWENTISVVDVSVLPVANEANKGVIWINSERIEYTGVDSVSNKLLGIIRGTRGTTANPTIASGSQVYNGEETENIASAGLRDPQDLNWLKSDADANADSSYVTVSLCDTSGDATENTIVGFIQGST